MNFTAPSTVSKDGSLTFDIKLELIKGPNGAGGSLSDTLGYDLSHSHSITFTEGGGGSITLVIGPTTSATSNNHSFNMANTRWFAEQKALLLAQGRDEGWDAAANTFTRSNDRIYGPAKGGYEGRSTRSYQATATLEGHSYKASSLNTSSVTVNGYTYRVVEDYEASTHSSGSLDIEWSEG